MGWDFQTANQSDTEAYPIFTGDGLDLRFAALLTGDSASEPRPITLKIAASPLAEFMMGVEFTFYGRNCNDVVNFIGANFDGFGAWVRDQEALGNYYGFVVDGQVKSLDCLYHGISAEVEIIELIPGSGAAGRILIGAALIGSAFIPGLPVLAIGASKIALSAVALSLGVSLVLGGLASLLTPKKSDKNETSTSLGGALSRSPQGRPIPIVFGDPYVNLSETGIVLSAGVDVRDVPVGGGGKGGGKGGKS